jgi:hypothetical protein
MPPKGFTSLQVRDETARVIRFAAVLSGMSVVDYCDSILRVWVSRSIQAGLTGSTPERLRRIMNDQDQDAGQVIPFQK